jgi:hypothetical protein
VYVAPTPLYAPQQPQTKVIIVEQPRYRDSGRMERHHPYDNDHGDNYRNNSSRMELQPNRSGDTYRNGSNRPVQPVIQPHIDNRPTFQPTQPVQPVIQPHIDNRPTFQPTQPVIQPHIDNRPTFQPTQPTQPVIQLHIDNRPTFQPHMNNHPRRDSNGSVH